MTLRTGWVLLTFLSFAVFQHMFLPLNGFQSRRNHFLSRRHVATTWAKMGTDSTGEINAKIVRNVILWASEEPLNRALPKDTLYGILEELKDGEFLQKSKEPVQRLLSKLELFFQNEKRPLQSVIGVDASRKLLIAVGDLDIYDATTVQAFLQAPAFEQMIGGILYEGIFEFLQRVDIIGNIVNSLPVIGPVRQLIVKEFKQALDKTLGGQVKSFLASFNRVAVQRMSEFVLSKQNAPMLRTANQNLVKSLLDKPVCDLIPSAGVKSSLSTYVVTALRELSIDDVKIVVEKFYDIFGTKTLSEYIDIPSALKDLPSLETLAVSTMQRFVESEQGKESLKILQG